MIIGILAMVTIGTMEMLEIMEIMIGIKCNVKFATNLDIMQLIVITNSIQIIYLSSIIRIIMGIRTETTLIRGLTLSLGTIILSKISNTVKVLNHRAVHKVLLKPTWLMLTLFNNHKIGTLILE